MDNEDELSQPMDIDPVEDVVLAPFVWNQQVTFKTTPIEQPKVTFSRPLTEKSIYKSPQDIYLYGNPTPKVPLSSIIPVKVEMEPFDQIVDAIQRKNKYQMSSEQLDICRVIYDNSARNILIDSTAGSGKTSTLLQCLWFIPPNSRVLLLSFNKSVQLTLQQAVSRTTVQVMESLQREMPRCNVFTSHSHGRAAIRRHFASLEGGAGGNNDLDEPVYDNKQHMVQLALNELGESDKLGSMIHIRLKKWKWHIAAMLRLLMNLAVDCTEDAAWSEEFIIESGEKYGVPVPTFNDYPIGDNAKKENLTYQNYMSVLHRSYVICCERTSDFDFTDMVYLPVRLGLSLIQYDVVLIDESQDLNAVQIELISRSIATQSGRVIFVGDKNQSIYGFRGADTHAIDTVMKRFNAVALPLHVCWRCPVEVINSARLLVPRIRARPGAPIGRAVIRPADDLIDIIMRRDTRLGHLVLCRTNAPLIDLIIQLHKKKVPSFLTANALRDSLQNLLDQIVNATWIDKAEGRRKEGLLDKADKYRTWKRKAMKETGEECIEKNDQMDSLYDIIKSAGTFRKQATQEQVQEKIDQLFGVNMQQSSSVGSDIQNVVKLSTIHQCKGQEEDVVYIIRTDLLPHPACQGEWQLEQEQNLKYVAITRAKAELYYFTETKK